MRDPANLLGQHPYSADGLDQHDLPELLPPFPRYLTLVFPHDDWDAEFDYYASDFHAVDPSQVDQWLFEVRSDDPQRNLLLSWSEVQAIEGEEKSRGKGAPFLDPATLIGRMWLEDVDTGTRIPVADEATKKRYAFNMNGKKIRTFRWVLEDGKGRAPVRRGHKPASWSDTPAANAPGQPPLPQIPPGLAR